MDASDVMWMVEQLLTAYANPDSTGQIEDKIADRLARTYNMKGDVDLMFAVRDDVEWACSFSRDIFCKMELGTP